MYVDMGGFKLLGKVGAQGFFENGGSQGVHEKGGSQGGFTKREVHVNPMNPPGYGPGDGCKENQGKITSEILPSRKKLLSSRRKDCHCSVAYSGEMLTT